MNEITTSMPVMYRVEQRLAGASLADVAGAIRDGFDRLMLPDKVQTGQKVAVAVGSRGICQLQTLVKAVVERLAEVGAEVFIIPAPVRSPRPATRSSSPSPFRPSPRP